MHTNVYTDMLNYKSNVYINTNGEKVKVHTEYDSQIT